MDPRLAIVRRHIRDIPDFPRPGILFRDITPLLAAPAAFQVTIDLLAERYADRGIDEVVAIESRGFIFGAPLAMRLGVGMQVIRKPGKLPAETDEVSYTLEYGSGTLQIHRGSLARGARAVVVDDLLATGGTASAAAELVQRQGAEPVEACFIIELEGLGGRELLAPLPAHALLTL